MPNPFEGKDRRRFTRIYRNFILSYYEKNNAAQKYDISQVNNISRGGVNFIAVRPFDINTKLCLELKTPYLTDVVLLEGIVLGSKEKIPKLIYEVRMEFQDLSEQANDVLGKIELYAQGKG